MADITPREKKDNKGLRHLLNNKVDSRKLQIGDHIYAYRGVRIYSHHGIYVNPNQVIHYIVTKPKSESKSHRNSSCKTCGYRKNVNLGVVKTCLDCFLSEGSSFASRTIRRYQYSVSKSWYLLKRAGTCSTYDPKPPKEVVQTAMALYSEPDGFGNYHLLTNNCENFATYCKTGFSLCAQVQKVASNSLAITAMAVTGVAVVGLAYLISKKDDDDDDNDDDDDDDVIVDEY